MADTSSFKKYNIHSQLEHIQSKYTGCGSPDTTVWEWQTTVHRDTLASHVGRHNCLSFLALVENEAIARVKFGLLNKMIQPCGPPPREGGQ